MEMDAGRIPHRINEFDIRRPERLGKRIRDIGFARAGDGVEFPNCPGRSGVHGGQGGGVDFVVGVAEEVRVVEDVGDGGAPLARGVAGGKGVRVDAVLTYETGGVDSGGDEVGGADFERGDVGCCRRGPPFSVACVREGVVDLGGKVLPFCDVGRGAASPAGGWVVSWFVAEFVVEDFGGLVLLRG